MKRSELCHHGILGQRWGIRRFQNEDGSLTPDGARRYIQNAMTAAQTYAPMIGAITGQDPAVTDAIVNDVSNKVSFLMSQNYEKMVQNIMDPKNIGFLTKAVSRAVSDIGDRVITNIKNEGMEYLMKGDREGFNNFMQELGTNTGMAVGYNASKMYRDYAKENNIKTEFDPFANVKSASSGATLGKQLAKMYSDTIYDRYATN